MYGGHEDSRPYLAKIRETYSGVEVVPSHFGPLRQAGQEGPGLCVPDEGRFFRRRGSKDLLDLGDLVEVIPARKDRLVGDHLSQDAADAPHVH